MEAGSRGGSEVEILAVERAAAQRRRELRFRERARRELVTLYLTRSRAWWALRPRLRRKCLQAIARHTVALRDLGGPWTFCAVRTGDGRGPLLVRFDRWGRMSLPRRRWFGAPARHSGQRDSD